MPFNTAYSCYNSAAALYNVLFSFLEMETSKKKMNRLGSSTYGKIESQLIFAQLDD